MVMCQMTGILFYSPYFTAKNLKEKIGGFTKQVLLRTGGLAKQV